MSMQQYHFVCFSTWYWGFSYVDPKGFRVSSMGGWVKAEEFCCAAHTTPIFDQLTGRHLYGNINRIYMVLNWKLVHVLKLLNDRSSISINLAKENSVNLYLGEKSFSVHPVSKDWHPCLLPWFTICLTYPKPRMLASVLSLMKKRLNLSPDALPHNTTLKKTPHTIKLRVQNVLVWRPGAMPNAMNLFGQKLHCSILKLLFQEAL